MSKVDFLLIDEQCESKSIPTRYYESKDFSLEKMFDCSDGNKNFS